jgi:hypothetical protein
MEKDFKRIFIANELVDLIRTRRWAQTALYTIGLRIGDNKSKTESFARDNDLVRIIRFWWAEVDSKLPCAPKLLYL